MKLTKPIYFTISSIAQLAALKAVCAARGIDAPIISRSYIEDGIAAGQAITVGNFSTASGRVAGVYSGFELHGYSVGSYPSATHLTSINELISYEEPKKFRLYVREIRVVPVEIEAKSLEDAQEKVREGDGDYLNEQATHSDLSTEDYFDIFGERAGEEIK